MTANVRRLAVVACERNYLTTATLFINLFTVCGLTPIVLAVWLTLKYLRSMAEYTAAGRRKKLICLSKRLVFRSLQKKQVVKPTKFLGSPIENKLET